VPDQVLGHELVVDAALVLVVHQLMHGRGQPNDPALFVELGDQLVQSLVPLGVGQIVPVKLCHIVQHRRLILPRALLLIRSIIRPPQAGQRNRRRNRREMLAAA
jgi:hypothetical protein